MLTLRIIWAIVIRYLSLYKRDINLLVGTFYWPLLDILIWGFLGSWIAQSHMAEFHNYKLTAIMGVLLWQIVGRGCSIMAMALMEELWSNNITNIFSLPLRTSEWLCGIIFFNIIMVGAASAFCMLAAFALYALPIWQTISTFFIFWPPLFFSSVWIGLTCLQVIITLGKRGMELGWMIGWFLMPFSGAYYPIEVLPIWGQKISAFLPMSYVFQGMRGYLMHQQDPTVYIIKGTVLSILYASCAIMLFIYFFNRSKRKGLARLAD